MWTIRRIRHAVLSLWKRRLFESYGKNLSFSPENSTFHYKTITLGDEVFIGKEAIFSCDAKIGNYVMFGPRVYITSGRHEFNIVGKRIRYQGGAEVKKVIIEDDCWIGEGSLILRGVRIGEGTVVGGMSVVSKSLPPYVVCVGSPCRPIKLRYSDSELEQHLRILNGPNYNPHEMIERRHREIESGGFSIHPDGSIHKNG